VTAIEERRVFELVRELAGVCSVGYDAEIGAVVVTWLVNDDEAFQPMLETQLQLVTEHHASTVVVDTLHTRGMVDDENQDWLVDDYFPRLADTGLKAIIFVQPKSAITRIVNQRSFQQGDYPFSMIEVASLDDALDLARKYAAAL
jgi:hypothetical protein